MKKNRGNKNVAVLTAASGKLGRLFWELNQMYLNTLLNRHHPQPTPTNISPPLLS